MNRPRAAGWKQRRDLGLVRLDNWTWAGASALVQVFRDAHLNLPFFLLRPADELVEGGLALETAQCPCGVRLARALAQEHGWPQPGLSQPVVALTLFPLAGDLALPAEVLARLAREGLAPLALATSPAALTMILSEGDLPRAVELLGPALGLQPEPRLEVVSVVQGSSPRKA